MEKIYFYKIFLIIPIILVFYHLEVRSRQGVNLYRLVPGIEDLKPTAGRLANYLDIHIHNFVALALAAVKPRNYQKIQIPQKRKDLPLPDTA